MLIERSHTIGRGIAYGSQSYPYLLNVPASRMSATSGAPSEFLDFARRRDAGVSPHDFLPRALYGEYLEALLEKAARAAVPGVRLETLRAEALDLRPAAGAAPIEIVIRGAPSVAADTVVLATGHAPPRRWPELDAIRDHPGLVADPWGPIRAYRPRENVLILGSGLTMADVVSSGVAAESSIRVWSLSRHGLVPPAQTEPRPAFPAAAATALLIEASSSIRRLIAAMQAVSALAEGVGGDWRDAVQVARQAAAELWHRLPDAERRRFLRHARALWEIHRHRLPGHVRAELEALRADGRLTVSAGRLRACASDGERILIRWRPRGAARDAHASVDRVVNATGPDSDVTRSTDPLWRALLAQGIAVPDALGLGIRTGLYGAVIDREGRPSGRVYYAGPLLRAAHWETTAARELRVYVETLARHLAADAGTD